MATKTMHIIQKILEHLDDSMDDEIVDISPFKHDALGISYPRWCRIIGMMMDEGLIDGFLNVGTLGTSFDQYKAMEPKLL